jgi:hypothetical protein
LDFKLVVIASRILSLEHAVFDRYIPRVAPHRVRADIVPPGTMPSRRTRLLMGSRLRL